MTCDVNQLHILITRTCYISCTKATTLMIIIYYIAVIILALMYFCVSLFGPDQELIDIQIKSLQKKKLKCSAEQRGDYFNDD